MGHHVWLVALLTLSAAAPLRPSPGEVSERLRSDLLILQAAIEAHRGQHFWRYPSATSPEALISMLKEEAVLPDTYQPIGAFGEFRLGADGYRISASTSSQTFSIVSPLRYDPFWSFLW